MKRFRMEESERKGCEQGSKNIKARVNGGWKS